MEPQAIVASYDHSGKLNVWLSSMGTFLKRAKLANTLGLPYGNVRVLKTYVGGAFGGKIDLFNHEYIASLLSMKCHLPVRIVYSREEVFKGARHAQPLIVELKTGVARDGTILAHQVQDDQRQRRLQGKRGGCHLPRLGIPHGAIQDTESEIRGILRLHQQPRPLPQRGHGAPRCASRLSPSST